MAGDFNGDGWVDLAISGGGHEGVSVMLNSTDGGFGDPISYPMATDLIAAGTFSGSGGSELAGQSGIVELATDGGLGLLALLDAGIGAWNQEFLDELMPVVADLMLDGNPDLVLPGGSWLGNGQGQLAQNMSNPNFIYAWGGVADVNNDGIPDFALGWYEYEWVNAGLVPVLGQGDGTFVYPMGATLGWESDEMVVLDLNSDGVPDLVMVQSNGVSVYLGVGDGTFLDGGTYLGEAAQLDLVTGDFNGDGLQDIVSLAGGGVVTLLLGQDGGAFVGGGVLAGPPKGTVVLAGDFVGNGNLGIAVLSVADQSILVFGGGGNGSLYRVGRCP